MSTNWQIRGAAILLLMLVIVVVPGCASLSRTKRFLIFPKGAPTRVQVNHNEFIFKNYSLCFSRLQLIAGMGLPVDLDAESLTVGYVFKAEYFLPFNASELYEGIAMPFVPHPIQAEGRKSRSAPVQYADSVNEKNVERYTVEAKVIPDETDNRNYDSHPNENTVAKVESHWYDSDIEDAPENNGYSLNDLKIQSPQDLSHSRFTLYRALETLAEASGIPGRPCLLRSICETAEAPFSYSNGILGELAHLIMTWDLFFFLLLTIDYKNIFFPVHHRLWMI